MFYTDGSFVYNKNHIIMPNGSGLFGHTSSTQSATIVPKPNDANVFYVFTTTELGEANGLNYSIVDMSLENGLGGVTTKNVQLHTPTLEKLTTVRHSNGNAVWVIAHRFNNDAFNVYLIDENGVNTTPVVSNVGPAIGPGFGDDVIGSLKASPDGTRVVMTNKRQEDGSQIFDFNATTGVLTNAITINTLEHCYGAEFSSSSDVLYVTEGFIPNRVFQYDLNAVDIPASEIVIFDSPNNDTGQLQLGPDQKIYLTRANRQTIDVIEYPNIVGVGCNYTQDAVSLNGQIAWIGLPSFVQSYFNAEFQTDENCIDESIAFTNVSTINYDTIFWDFGDGNTSSQSDPSHTYNIPGDYIVSLILTVGSSTATDVKTITVHKQPIAHQPNNMIVCDDDNNGVFEFSLLTQNASILNGQSTLENDITYHLSLDDANNNIDAIDFNYTNTENPQTIFVRMENVNNISCHATTSFNIEVVDTPVLNMESEWFLCDGEAIDLIADDGYDTYLWSTGETTRIISVTNIGSYTVTASNNNNGFLCEASKIVNVVEASSINAISVDIIDWTQNNNSIIVFVNGTGAFEYSLDGINFQDNNQFYNLTIDNYTIYVQDKEGCSLVTKEISLLNAPSYFTPNGDDINETWQIYNASKEPKSKIFIYDRYGKLLAKLSPLSRGWEGTFNGAPLPASDYWYVVERQNGKRYSGHFALKR